MKPAKLSFKPAFWTRRNAQLTAPQFAISRKHLGLLATSAFLKAKYEPQKKMQNYGIYLGPERYSRSPRKASSGFFAEDHTQGDSAALCAHLPPKMRINELFSLGFELKKSKSVSKRLILTWDPQWLVLWAAATGDFLFHTSHKHLTIMTEFKYIYFPQRVCGVRTPQDYSKPAR